MPGPAHQGRAGESLSRLRDLDRLNESSPPSKPPPTAPPSPFYCRLFFSHFSTFVGRHPAAWRRAPPSGKPLSRPSSDSLLAALHKKKKSNFNLSLSLCPCCRPAVPARPFESLAGGPDLSVRPHTDSMGVDAGTGWEATLRDDSQTSPSLMAAACQPSSCYQPAAGWVARLLFLFCFVLLCFSAAAS